MDVKRCPVWYPALQDMREREREATGPGTIRGSFLDKVARKAGRLEERR